MRILHVIPSLEQETGGPARSVPALCRSLHAAGADVTLCTFKRNGRNTTVSTETEPYRIQWQAPFPGSRQIPTYRFLRYLRQELRSVDLVHLNSLWNPAISLAALACRRAGVPYVVSPRGMLQRAALERRRMLKSVYYRLFERYTLGGARAVHFFSENEASDARPLICGRAFPFVIPNGIDLDLGKNVTAGRFRRAYPTLKGRRILLFIGRLHVSKGLDLQLQALTILVKRFPDIVWVLVGPDQGEWAYLSREISTLDLKSYVLWTGQLSHERCLEALADADVFLLTSRHEAHSMAMNEALCMGVPMVMTDSLHCQKIEEARAGCVVSWDPVDLAGAVADILRDQDLAASMRQAGPQLAAEWLAWPNVANTMIRAYVRVLGAPIRSDSSNGKSHAAERHVGL